MTGSPRRILAALALLALWTGPTTVRSGPLSDRLLDRVRILTAPELAGRGSGTEGLRAAGDTLATWLRTAGLTPAFGGDWFQEFELHGKGWTGNDLAGKQDRNVAGLLPGTGALARRYVIVGAHLDHLGRVVPAAPGAAPPGADGYYPGANDNASGVAVVSGMIDLVRSRAPADRRSVIFAFFGGEEVGLQGSAYFVAHPPVALDKVDAMINFDTVGQIADRRLYVSGVGTSPAFAELVTAANTGGLKLSTSDGGWSGSDHMNFNRHQVPALFVFGGPYPQYNRPTDTWDALTPDGLAAVANYGDRLLDLIRVRAGDLPWVAVAGAAGDSLVAGEGNRDTWFGSMPDFATEVRGYRLGGVFDDSPAARAGLAVGDVLVALGGREVRDLASFTRALRAHDPGDLVEAEILRDGKPLKFTVVLGDRADRR